MTHAQLLKASATIQNWLSLCAQVLGEQPDALVVRVFDMQADVLCGRHEPTTDDVRRILLGTMKICTETLENNHV